MIVNGKNGLTNMKLDKPYDKFLLELTVDGTTFPNMNTTSDTFLTGGVSSNNKMYIDYDDGTGPHVYTTTFINHTKRYYYQNLDDPEKIGTFDPSYPQKRKIKIWFDDPNKITTFTIQNIRCYGSIPTNIKNYPNIWSLRFSTTNNFNNIPKNFIGGRYTYLYFNLAVNIKITKLEPWIYNTTTLIELTLLNDFNFNSNPETESELNKLRNLTNLEKLSIGGNIETANFPTVLPTLRKLRILKLGGNRFTSIPDSILDCDQIEQLTISMDDGHGYNDWLVSLGKGFHNMTSLKILEVAICRNLSPTPPYGIEYCPNLTRLNFKVSFNTTIKIDLFVNNFFDFVLEKQIKPLTIDIGSNVSVFYSVRPSGEYRYSETPETPMEKIYYLVNTLKYTIIVRSATNHLGELLAP